MPDAALQCRAFCAVIDGQVHADLGHLHIAHDAVALEVQQLLVRFLRFAYRRVGIPDRFPDRVVSLRLRPGFPQGCVVRRLDFFHILAADDGLILFVDIAADQRIEDDADRNQEQKPKQAPRKDLSFHTVSYLGAARGGQPPLGKLNCLLLGFALSQSEEQGQTGGRDQSRAEDTVHPGAAIAGLRQIEALHVGDA